MKGTIFLSGKIAGDPEYKAKFQNAEEHFKKQGFKVINPATLPEGLTNTEYMRICFSMIEACDLVIFCRIGNTVLAQSSNMPIVNTRSSHLKK